VADWAHLGEIENFEKVGVNRGFASGNLNHVWLNLVPYHCVQHSLDLIEGSEVLPFGPA
jgi:hypothetical protein